MSASENESDLCPACSEHRPARTKETWIECSHCETWYHVVCINLPNPEEYDKWYCVTCLSNSQLQLAPTMRPPRRRSHRARAVTDYAAIEEGRPSDPLGRWATLLAQYEDWPVRVRRVDGSVWTHEWLATGKDALDGPVLVPAQSGDFENPASHIPGMRMPPRRTTIRDIAKLVGPDTHVEVIDVRTQMSSRAWTLNMWADYFETPSSQRDSLLNVISLEITGTPMQAMIEAPRMVRESDWVERDWPLQRRPCGAEEAHTWPKVQRYVLMGVEGAFTDFHIDFAATWVYYHVVWGRKLFLFAPPTPANLARYKDWTMSVRQESEWLGDQLDQLQKVEIRTGESMLIPAGWIHAVYTYEDTLVVGGNFLTDFDVGMHWRIEEMESATYVPRKFRFPHLVRLAWYVAQGWLDRLERGKVPLAREREGIHHLVKRLESEMSIIETCSPTSKLYKKALDSLPRGAIKDPRKLLASLRAHIHTHDTPSKRQRRRYER